MNQSSDGFTKVAFRVFHVTRKMTIYNKGKDLYTATPHLATTSCSVDQCMACKGLEAPNKKAKVHLAGQYRTLFCLTMCTGQYST